MNNENQEPTTPVPPSPNSSNEGTPLGQTPDTPSAPPQPPQSPLPKSNKPIIITIVIALVLLIGGAAAWYFLREKPEDANKNQNTTTQQPDTQTEVVKESQLCYIDYKTTQPVCYEDSSLATATVQNVLKDLQLRNIVASPTDDRLAIVAGDPGNFSVYTVDSSLQPVKIDLGSYQKSDYSVSWLDDGSGIVFEVSNPTAASPGREILKYTFADKKLTKLTDSGAYPLVGGDKVAYWKMDKTANPTTLWRWYTMGLDGSGQEDLGINGGFGGTMLDGKLVVAGEDGKFVTVDLQTKQQTPLQGDKLVAPSSTSNGLIALDDGRLAYTFMKNSADPSSPMQIAIVDPAKNTTTILDAPTAVYLFQTALLRQ